MESPLAEINSVIKSNPAVEEMPRIRVTAAEISALKKQHILDNLCYTPDEAGAIFGKSGKWALDRVKDGKLEAVDENAKPGKNGLQLSVGARITARSVGRFHQEFRIAPERWSE